MVKDDELRECPFLSKAVLKKKEKAAMPKLTDADARYDFGLSNIEFNRRVSQKLLDEECESIYESRNYILAFAVSSGVIYLFSIERNHLEFYCSICHMTSSTLGSVARQDAIWKRRGTIMPDVASANFSWLLHRYETVMSSSLQTVDGQRFWKVRLRESVERGLSVGVWDNGQIKRFESSMSLDDWLVREEPWGTDSASEKRLVFVSRK